ncbi:MAG: zinc-ribbon domain-containing protein [Thermoplasmata archaeon]
MLVCLHCGELANDGALFCTKCGFTLPQVDTGAGVNPTLPPRPSNLPGNAPAPTPLTGVPSPTMPGPTVGLPPVYPPGGYALLSPPVPGAVGPMPPPPAGKYCIRCRTVISRVAVYCPVCQQPQS